MMMINVKGFSLSIVQRTDFLSLCSSFAVNGLIFSKMLFFPTIRLGIFCFIFFLRKYAVVNAALFPFFS